MSRDAGESDDLDAARRLLPGVELRAREQLRGGERTTVTRVEASWPDRPPGTVVAKRFHQAGEGWAREAAALSALPPGAASGLIAVGSEPPMVITEDLGAGASLADVLLGEDATAASDAVTWWAEALARVHTASRALRERFTSALEGFAGELPIDDCRVGVETDDAVRALDAHCASLGVSIPTGALDELRSLAVRLGACDTEDADHGPAALSPTDTCPDNNVRVADRLVLIDFEGAQWRHVAWDVAYLFVPWPSCWCSWRIPDGVARRAFDAYREAAADTFPEVASDSFERDVAAATTGWALTSSSWYLDNALGSDPTGRPGQPTPTRRAMISHRLAVAAAVDELPAVAALAVALRSELVRRWGDVPLGPAPAFR